MNRITLIAVASLALAACSGGYSSGGSGFINPPVRPQDVQSGLPGAETAPSSKPGQPTATPSAPPGDSVTYAFADAVNGVRCPSVSGYSCIIHLNVPAATPSPKPFVKGVPSPTPTPTPTPSPSASASISSQPSPSATPSLTLQLEAQPHDAPSMVNPNAPSVSTTALIALRLATNADVALSGTAAADFILPQGQTAGRGFAVQLFRETTTRHNRHTDMFVGSYAKSTATGTTLHFALTPPHVTIKAGETWLLVLYADELPPATSARSPGPSLIVSPSVSPSPSPSA